MTQQLTARVAFTLGLLMAMPLQAHEFWFAPIAPSQAVGDTVTVRLEVGEYFAGETAGMSIPTTQVLRHVVGDKQEDLRPNLSPAALEAEVAMQVDDPGTHMLAYDSTPQRIALSADKFHAYLHDEGLDFVKRQRELAGSADQPGREQYQRHIKTLFQVGTSADSPGRADRTYCAELGQRLEIVPLADPLQLLPGGDLRLRVLFERRALPGALVKAWHRHHGQLLLTRATTSATGEVTLSLPYAGDWMVSVVHMVPAAGQDGVDWDSFWGNLSFHMSGLP